MIVSGNFWMEQIRPCGPFIGRQPTRSAGARIEIEHRARAGFARRDNGKRDMVRNV